MLDTGSSWYVAKERHSNKHLVRCVFMGLNLKYRIFGYSFEMKQTNIRLITAQAKLAYMTKMAHGSRVMNRDLFPRPLFSLYYNRVV